MSLGGASAPAAPVDKNAGAAAVDDTKPTTTIQIRFPDGSKRAEKFNLDARVGDVEALVKQCYPGAFKMVEGFPPKPLTDMASTIQAAGLAGAQVTVRPA
mmetsp:Transcript_76087/g.174286  ORF Transcript_76087/g.174286 Transcript_76087/m.174286 type:complete len:100 (-) Transcript_76087:176-475(-)